MYSNVRAILATVFLTVLMVGCGGTSSPYVATTPPALAPPKITTQPQSVTVWSPATATFSVQATGDALQYQWKKNGIDLAGQIQNAYITPLTSVDDHGTVFTVVVSNSGGPVTSNAAVLSVNEKPTILQNPGDLSVLEGQPATFTVQGHGTPVLQYQWKRNGTAIPGATSTTYTIPATVRTDNGATFTVVVTNALDSTTSAPAKLTVGSATAPPVITQQPTTLTVLVGQTGSFTVGANGTAPLRYQWRKNGTPMAGQTANVLTFTNAQDTDAGTYDVLVQNDAGTATSQAATLTVVVTPPSILTQPADTVVGTGQKATFTVVAAGSPVLQYQWRKNGTDLPGATANSYTTPVTTLADDFSLFSVRIKNSAGTTLSDNARLRVFLARTLRGQLGTLFETPAGEVSVPQDLSSVGLEAIQPNGQGGFVHYPGVGLADGTFSIAGVPPGPFYAFVLGSGGAPTAGLWTTNEFLDLRSLKAGRADGVLATKDQALLALSILGPLAGQTTRMQAIIPTLGLAQEQLGTGSTYRFPWKGLPLADDAKDELWAVGLATQTAAGTAVTTIAGALEVPAFAIAPTSETRKDVTLAATLANQTATWQVNADAYANLLPSINPAVNAASRGLLRVDLLAQPLGFDLGPLPQWPLVLGFSTSQTGSLVDSGALRYGDPFPSTWGRFVRLRQEFTFDLVVPGLPQPTRITDAIQELWPQNIWPAAVRTPILGPVVQGRLNGQDFFNPQAHVGLTPTLNWTVRLQDHPTYYVVTLFKVNPSDGSLSSRLEVTTETASLAVADGLLETGSQYVARIEVVFSNGYNPGLPLRPSWSVISAPVYTAVFQP